MNRKEVLLISITIFMTIILWVVVDIYHASKIEQVKENKEILQPINTDIDINVFKVLKDKMP